MGFCFIAFNQLKETFIVCVKNKIKTMHEITVDVLENSTLEC